MDSTPLIQHFVDDLKAVIQKYCDQDLTNAEAIGGLEIVKLDIYMDSQDCDDEFCSP